MKGRLTEAQVRRELARMDAQAARRRARIGTVVVMATALLAGMLAARFMFTLAGVKSDGMGDVLRSGDVALCVRADAPLLAEAPGRGSLALVRYAENGMLRQTVRRVIALAGDEISVSEDGDVTLNGAPLDEPYASYRAQDDWTGGESLPGGALENPFSEAEPQPSIQAASAETAALADDLVYPITVPEGMAFVLCDNRDNVLDSRSSRFGLVAEADVLGLARAIIWPVYRVGLLGGA